MARQTPDFRSAFSLVELSIVLVILGLLVGGILSGQALIRASQLRAVVSEYQRYTTAVSAFRDKYFQFPGDMSNAESFWGTYHATAADCLDGASTTTATCNGDADGAIEARSARSRELYRFWQHLSNAALIEGQYTGTSTGGLDWTTVLGTNSPGSKLPNAGWTVIAQRDIAFYTGWYSWMFAPIGAQNWFMLGAIAVNGATIAPALRPEEAWNLDTKMDDGRPGQGKMTTFDNTVHSCVSSNDPQTAVYELASSTIKCTMLMAF